MNAPSERTSTKSTASGFLQGSFDDDVNDVNDDGNDVNDGNDEDDVFSAALLCFDAAAASSHPIQTDQRVKLYRKNDSTVPI